jgi:flagellar hook-associated protein 3 FlgL
MSITRLGTAHMYDRTITNISKQQAELANQMEHASAGKRVIRASDDPVAAAQAERARTRLSRIETDQRQLDAQTATIQYGESTLGEINTAVQEFRSLIVNAGNGAFNQTQRDTLVEQLQSLRAQVLAYSNRKDSNGLPLFRGLDTLSETPFPNGEHGIHGGQPNGNDYTITNSLDGVLAFHSGKTGNGVLAVDVGSTNQGTAWADVGAIKDPAAADLTLTGPLTITFKVDGDVTTYSVTQMSEVPSLDTNGDPITDGLGNPVMVPGPVPALDANGAPMTDIAYQSGEAITIAGMALTITGAPSDTDTFEVKASESLSIFDALDRAIAAVKNNVKPDGSTDHGALAHGLAKSLAELDTQLNRISTVRGVAGDLLTQAERMGSTLLLRNEQMEAQRSGAEDIDAVAALSQLKTQETMVSAALQSYASIQKLSLFDYIG